MANDEVTLGAFLRSRRDALTPAQAGITPMPGARRVPGLRKEELAFLVGLSTDHYSRIEQGRQSSLSEDVIGSLARALQLDDVETSHLRDLAVPAGRRRQPAERPARPEPGMLRLMSQLDHVPALLLGRRSEVLASNALLREVLGWPAEPGQSLVRWLFLEPEPRTRLSNWAELAASVVASLRFEVGRHPDDDELIALVTQLRESEPLVGQWWDDHRVTFRTSVTKHLEHPVAGPLVFAIESVVGPHDPDQRLIVYTVEPDSPTARVMGLLTSWAHGAAASESSHAISPEAGP